MSAVTLKTTTFKLPESLTRLYALSDAERFPASQLADGLERASSLYYADFKVAIPFGMPSVRDTFSRCYYKTAGYKMVTELAVVLNRLGWEYYDKGNMLKANPPPADKEKIEKAVKKSEELAAYFFERFNEVNDWASENLKGDEAKHYYAVLD